MSSPKQNIYDVVHNPFAISRIFGFAPISIVGDMADGIIRVKYFDVIRNLFQIVLCASVIYMNLSINLTLLETSSVLINLSSRGAAVGMSMNIFLAVVVFALQSGNLWSIIRNLNEVDQEVVREALKN